MGKATAFKTTVAKTLLKQGAGNVDELAKITKATDTAEGLADLRRTAEAAGAGDDFPTQLDRALETQRLSDMEAAETQRLVDIDPKTRTSNMDAQAASPEEFKARVPQLAHPDYASDVLNKSDGSLNMQNPFDRTTVHAERYARWDADQQHVYNEAIRANPQMRKWADASAYRRKDVFGPDVDDPDGPVVFFRMDVKRDPRGDLVPIQFDPNAHEFGMHIGSKQAGLDIVSPEVRQNHMDRINNIRKQFALLGPEANKLFLPFYKELRTNLFLRHGEKMFEGPVKQRVDEIIDEVFATFKSTFQESGKVGIGDVTTPNLFKDSLRRTMLDVFDEAQHPVMVNVKKGLHVLDRGNNDADSIVRELIGRGIFNDDELEVIKQMATNAEQNVALRKMLKDDGYDHLVYINDGEDQGVLSIVVFDEANYQNLYKPTIGLKSGVQGHKAMVVAALAPLATILGLSDADIRQ